MQCLYGFAYFTTDRFITRRKLFMLTNNNGIAKDIFLTNKNKIN